MTDGDRAETTGEDAGGRRSTDSTDDSPDGSTGDGSTGDRPECPFCGSTDVERESAFGSEVSQMQFYCNGCRTVFERIKFDGERPDTGR